MTKAAKWCAVGAGVLVLFFGVWPTMYRYEHVGTGAWTKLVRVNRMTGDTWVLLPSSQWRHVENP